MRCHVCNAEVGDGQKFCHACGESLGGVTDATQALDMNQVFEQADAEGGSVGTALHWADEDTEPVAGAAVAGTTASADAAGSAISADLPTQPIDAADTASDESAGDSAAGGAAAAAVVAGAAVGGAAAVSAVDDATAPADDLWGTPTGERPVVAPPPIDAPPPPSPSPSPSPSPPVDPDATTAMGALRADPVAASEATISVAAVGGTTDPMAMTTPYAAGGDGSTDPMPPLFDGASDAAVFPVAPEPLRFRLTLVVALLAVVTAVLVAFADVTDVRTDRVVPGIENRLRTLDDIGSNLAVAAILGGAALLLGGVLHCFNMRWGAGLVGGAGLAMIGWSAVTIGLAEVPISTAEQITRDPNTPGPFILTVTRDIGYWLIVALGVLGLLAFLLSLVSARSDGMPGLNPWTAAVGALGGVVAAAGPLVPMGDATFSSNFGIDGLPSIFFAGRLVQVAMLGFGAMLGFLMVRRFGLGMAAGALSVPTFMWLTALADVGAAPVGLAVGNLGTTDIAPHAVTTVGMVVALLMLAVAATIAIVQRPR